MGFNDEYLELRKKRKKDQEETKTSKSKVTSNKTGHSFTDEYNSLRGEREIVSVSNDDIAPVRTTKKNEDRTWFKGGALDDGYQFGDVTKTILGTAGDAALGVVKGIGYMGEGVGDLINYADASISEKLGNQQRADRIRKRTQESVTDIILGGLEKKVDRFSVLGDKADSVTQGIGQVGAVIATGGLGAAAGLGTVGATGLTMGLMGASSAGSGMSEAYLGGATDEEAATYGIIKGVVDAGSEMIFGGLGKAVKAVGLSRGLTSLDDVFAQKLASRITNNVAKNFVEYGVKASAEGVEEVLAGIGSAVGKKLTYMDDKELSSLVKDENLMEQFVVGAVTSGIAQSGLVPGMKGGSLVESNKTGRDFISGNTQNEQKVIDKVVKDRIAEEEKNGKLSNKDKNKIYDDVVRDMERGYIDIDTIEEVLGGDTYKAYKDTVDSEDALAKEYKELGDLERPTLAQTTRFNELHEQMKTKDDSKRKQLKSKLSKEVFGLVKGDRLSESYNERARKGQAFEADLTKYDAKQQETIKKAVESGILNNTRRTHEFVDMIAKITADKGVLFDFTNNERLKESGFAVDGKTVNGYVTKDGVTLNIQSAKSLNSVVGHEITHVLEGTELYTALQSAVVEYAKTKGDYDGRYEALTKLYEAVEGADVDAELTADLVGDYLFTDSDFINNLHTNNRNVFQKIYDEIKYLCKVATAGSKEARELEKVKRAFEKAYKADSKAESDTKYSVSDSSGKELTKEQQEYFKDSKVRDENGNLKVMWRGGNDDFTVFDRKKSSYSNLYGRGFYFTDSESHAKQYGNARAFYLDIKNPVSTTEQTITEDQMRNFLKAVAENDEDYSFENYGYGATVDSVLDSVYSGKSDFAMLYDVSQTAIGDMVAAVELFNEVNGTDYDGLILDTETVAFRSNQTKSVANEKPTADKDIRYSLSDSDYNQLSYAEISLEQQNLHQREIRLEERKREANNNPELLQALDDYHSFFDEMKVLLSKKHKGTATQEELARIEEIKGLRDEHLKRVADIQESLGLSAIAEEEREIRELREALRVASDAAWAREGAEKENKAIEKSGLSAPEYFRKKALKAFKTTTNFNEAGYMLPDGKLLNFSGGERNHRYRDHREIGEIYEATQGTAALNRFLNDGNIRIMAESPGIDLASGVEPTKEQYVALRRFINSHGTTEGQFFVDFSGAEGNRVGKYAYEGRVNADRVLNDIKYFYQNGEVREQSGLGNFLSLSNEGEQIAPIGNYNVYGNDIALEQETAPVPETTAETKTPVSKTKVEPMFPDDIAPMDDAYEEDRIASIDDADMPPETEAPYSESNEVTVDDPFEDRDWYDVGNRKVNAYMYENPEVKPFFQAEARVLLGELRDTTKGEKWYNDKLYYETNGEEGWGGTKRNTSDSIAEMLDSWKLSYADIEKGLKAIIEDNGAENIAVAKRIEFMLNERLLNGYQDFNFGHEVPPDQDYINLLNEKQVTEYSKEAFDSFMASADSYAPPISEEIVEDIAPTKETPKRMAYEAIRPKPEKQPRLVRATPEEQATASVMTEEPKVDKKKSNLWSMVKNNVLDKGMIFEDLSLATGNRELQARWNTIRYADGKAQRFMEKNLKPIIDTVEKSGKKAKFYEYLYHMHNADRMSLEFRYDDVPNKPVFGDAVTSKVSIDAATRLEKENPEFKRWAEDVYNYNRQNRELLVEGGVISREVADLWEEMYPHYVPIRRVGDEGLNINVPLDTGRTGVNAPIKRATGGNRDILPLFDTMGQRTMQTYKAVAKNRFGVELKNTLGTTIENEVLGLDEAIDSVDTQDGLLQEGKNGKKPTFTVFENGEKVTFEITDEMYDAMKPKSKGMAYTNKVLNTANNIRRGLLTEYNPAFMLTNPIKDTQDVLLNSQHPAKTYANYPKAIAELFGKGHWYQEYIDNGGEQNTYFESETNTFAKEKSAIRKIVGFPLDKISDANNFIERVPRMAEYIASRKAGNSVDVSMLDAARVTTNFAAGGDLTKFLNRNGTTFLNASVQGAMQQVRNVREAKANGLKGAMTLMAKLAAAGLPSILLNHLLWNDDEEYEELSDYVKQNYYIVGKYDDGKFVRIPKGRALAVIQNGFEQMENLITGNDEVDLATFGELLISNLAPNNPLDNNIFAPIGQAWSNTTWYGDDLVPTRLQDLPAAEQYDETTDEISKWLGEKLNVSPYKLNYLLDQYSGGVGDTFLPMITPEAERGNNTLIAPIADKFTTDSVLKNQNVSDFYTKKDELTMNAKMSNATDEDILMSKYMNSVNSELSNLYKQKREIQNSDLPDEEKYEAVRDIQKEIVALTKEGLDTYRDVSVYDEYANVGDRHYRRNKDGEWQKLTDDQLEKQEEVTRGLGIDASEYWSNKEEYDFAYEKPEKYAVAKSVGGYTAYKDYSSQLYDIKGVDNDGDGRSDTGTRKANVLEWINNLDADYGTRLILFKSEYPSYDDANYDIIEYLNGRDDISYDEMLTILKELDFDVSSDGTISW